MKNDRDEVICGTRKLLRRAAASADEIEMAGHVLEIVARLRAAAVNSGNPGGHVLTFGKYRDLTLSEVAGIDPDYLAWLGSDARDIPDDIAVAACLLLRQGPDATESCEDDMRAWNGEQPK